jgi:predicted alpha/beta hydrolase family esterase
MLSKRSIVISVLDDEVVPFSSGQDLSNRLNAKFILLNDGKHKLEKKNDFIANIISKL